MKKKILIFIIFAPIICIAQSKADSTQLKEISRELGKTQIDYNALSRALDQNEQLVQQQKAQLYDWARQIKFLTDLKMQEEEKLKPATDSTKTTPGKLKDKK